MKVNIDIPDDMAEAVMKSDVGKVAIEVAANILEDALANLEARVIRNPLGEPQLTLSEWIAETRKGIERMRAELL